jgi:hypothetical protein
MGVFVGVLFRPDDLTFVIGSITRERIGLGDVGCDDSGSMEFFSLRSLFQQSADGLSVHLPNRRYRAVTTVVAMGMLERCSITC